MNKKLDDVVNTLKNTDRNENDDSIFAISSSNGLPRQVIKVNGHLDSSMVETGSTVNIVDEECFEK